MGRPRKTTSVVVPQSEVKKVSSDTTSSDVLKKETVVDPRDEMLKRYEEITKNLQTQINELKNEIKLQSNSKKVNEVFLDEDDEFEANKLTSEDYIKVMSLVPWQLNLSVDGRGKRGETKQFNHLFQIHRIHYPDLVRMMDVYRHFYNQGLFCILDKRFIRRHGLEEVAEKVLSKELIESIINNSANDAFSLYLAASETQQEVIRQILVDKLVKGEFVDGNLAYKIRKASEIDIQETADNLKALIELKKKEEERK